MRLQSMTKITVAAAGLAVLLGGAVLAYRWSGVGSRHHLQLQRGDTIVFLGNTFAERMRLFGYFETFLHARYPADQLKIRNMGWSGDEPGLMPRPHGFGDVHKQLSDQGADVIFAFFGMNESFGGASGLGAFKQRLATFTADLQSRQYNGQSSPRIVLVSPIAHENLGGDRPDPRQHNQQLERYTAAMADVAAERSLPFVDLFEPTQKWIAANPGRHLTFNGIHLTEYGDWVVSRMMAEALDLIDSDQSHSTTNRNGNGNGGHQQAEQVRRVVYEKNYNFFMRWRGPNAEYIIGRRKATPGGANMPEEMAQLGRILEDYDRRIWGMEKPVAGATWDKSPEGPPMWVHTPGTESNAGQVIESSRDAAKAGDQERPKHKLAREILDKATLMKPDEAIRKFELPPGYEINLYASEQDFPITNVMALDFDARGRLWVANTPTWPQPVPGVRPRDSILILEDTDKDGKADKHTVFADHLDLIHGFALDKNGAYFDQAPNLVYASDTNSDSRADKFEIVLHGFAGTEDAEHSMNNFRWGPDGALYFTNGTFSHIEVETPRGPKRVLGSAMFRYKPDSEHFDVFIAYPFANPWGQVFDRWGEQFLLDASSGDYYYADSLASNFMYPNKDTWPRRGVNLSFAPPPTPPSAGFELIRSPHFPADVQGRLLVNEFCNIPNRTLWWNLQEKGTNYELTQLSEYKVSRVPSLELIYSSDPFFRPIALKIGPDGALYVLDFYSPIMDNQGFSKRDAGRDHSHGRIWRVTYKGRPLLERPEIIGRSTTELLDFLKAFENENTRYFARRALQQLKASDVVAALKQWVAALDKNDPHYEHHRLEGLWVYQGLNVIEADLLKDLLRSQDYRVRTAATRVLRFWQDDIEGSIDLLAKLVEDAHPRVRLQAVLASGFSQSPRARDVALSAAKHDLDPALKRALDETVAYLEQRAQQSP